METYSVASSQYPESMPVSRGIEFPALTIIATYYYFAKILGQTTLLTGFFTTHDRTVTLGHLR